MSESAAPAAPPLDVRPMRGTEEDVRRLQACFAANGSRKEMDALRWQYLQRPVPGTFVDFALDGEAVAGIHAVVPIPARIGGAVRPAGQTLDILTDARFRGRGVFIRLGDSVHARAAREGLAFVYGFPNASSAPGFFSKLGWIRLGTAPFLVRPLRTRYFLARLPRIGRALARVPDLPLPRPAAVRPDGTVEPLAEWGPELDAVWERFAAGIGVAVQRDAAYLRWRFGQKPGERYEARVLRRAGRVEGLVVWTVKEKHGGRIGYLMELLHDPARPDDGRALLAHAVREMAGERADAVLAWSLEHAPGHAAFRRTGFVPMPERLRPIQLHFGVRPLQPEVEQIVNDRRSWYISYCDSDTV